MTARRNWLLGTSLLAALLLAACSGNSPATPPASEATEVGATSSPATSAQAPTPAPTYEGELTGAPIPALDRQAAALDEDRLNLEGGTFPPLVDPAVIAAGAALLDDDALVLGAVQHGEARAYPLSMLAFHHVANDVLGGEPYLVTF